MQTADDVTHVTLSTLPGRVQVRAKAAGAMCCWGSQHETHVGAEAGATAGPLGKIYFCWVAYGQLVETRVIVMTTLKLTKLLGGHVFL